MHCTNVLPKRDTMEAGYEGSMLYPVGIVYEVRDHSLQTRLVFISKCEDKELRMMDADSGFRYSTTVQLQYEDHNQQSARARTHTTPHTHTHTPTHTHTHTHK